MSLEDKALALAKRFHEGQVDKGGAPYIEHLLFVSSKFDSEDLRIVGLLHDILEDTDCSVDDLRNEGFGDEIVDAVVAITKRPHEEYNSYLIRVSKNDLARFVKVFDLKHNMDLSRLPSISEEDIKRAAKYQDAIDYLLEDNEEFLDDMEFLDDLAFHINKRKKKSSGSLIFNRSGDYLM